MTTGTEEWLTVEHAVLGDEETASLRARIDGSPYHWHLALGADISPFQTNIFWIQEPHCREKHQSCYGLR